MDLARDAMRVRTLTVVVPTYDRAGSLLRTLRSLSSQSVPGVDFDILVLDDGSADDTRLRFAAWEPTSRVSARLVAQSHGGLNAARNRGLSEVSSQVAVLFDDDQEAPAGWLAQMVEALDRSPDAGCVGGPCFHRSPVPPPRTCGSCSLEVGTVDLGPPERAVRWVGGGNMAIRLGVTGKADGFDERLSGAGDEIEWESRLTALGIPIVFAPRAWALQHRSASEMTLPALVDKSFKRGRELAFARAIAGRPHAPSDELRRAARSLGHALRRGCWAGVVRASERCGRALGSLDRSHGSLRSAANGRSRVLR